MGFLRYMDDDELAAVHGLAADQDDFAMTVNLKYFISMPEYLLNL